MKPNHHLKICVVYGTRPEVIKLAPVIWLLNQRDDVSTTVVATGQHADLVSQTEACFGITHDQHLGLENRNLNLCSLGAELLARLGTFFTQNVFDVVLVQGDTASALFAAQAAFYARIPIGHVEAGLRTYDMENPFPEEMNRVQIADLASFHFTPTKRATNNLIQEGIDPESILLSGNTIVDAIQLVLNKSEASQDSNASAWLVDQRDTIFATIHRRENLGHPIEKICRALVRIVDESPGARVIFPAHPNPLVSRPVEHICGRHSQICIVEPLDYASSLHLIKNSTLIISDSGGIQEEACSMGVPIVICRSETERPEVVDYGLGKLVSDNEDLIVESALKWLAERPKVDAGPNPYGDGDASIKIIDFLADRLKKTCVK